MDYKVTDTELTSVADAIRTKGSTSAPLEWPDGFAQAVIDLPSGGGGNALVDIDLTKGNFTIGNVTINSEGATFDKQSSYLLMPFAKRGITLEVDVKTMALTSGTHRRFILYGNDSGLIYRSTGVWSFYDGSTWEDTNITDGSFFNNCTVKVVIGSDGIWHIYKNNVLVFEPAQKPLMTDQTWWIGSSSYSINNVVITGIRIY